MSHILKGFIPSTYFLFLLCSSLTIHIYRMLLRPLCLDEYTSLPLQITLISFQMLLNAARILSPSFNTLLASVPMVLSSAMSFPMYLKHSTSYRSFPFKLLAHAALQWWLEVLKASLYSDYTRILHLPMAWGGCYSRISVGNIK